MKDFESVIVITPLLNEEQMKDTVARYRQMITELGGQMVHEENWGLTKLAYEIQNKSTGFYHIFEYRVDPSAIDKIELAFRRDERLMRFMTISLDKHAVIYNQRKRNGEFNKKAAPAESITPNA